MTEAKEETVLTTESGIDYTEHEFKNDKGEEVKLKLFRSHNNARLTEEGETQQEYRLRRLVSKNNLKKRKEGLVVWNPYPFGLEGVGNGKAKGLTCNSKNREIVNAAIEAAAKKEEENDTDSGSERGDIESSEGTEEETHAQEA